LFSWELVVIEIEFAGFVLVPDIDDESRGILKICLGGLLAIYGKIVFCNQEATGEEIVFVCTARMSDDFVWFQFLSQSLVYSVCSSVVRLLHACYSNAAYFIKQTNIF